MRRVFVIARKELFSLFVTPVGYCIWCGFFLLCGYLFFELMGKFNLQLSRLASAPLSPAEYNPNLNQWVIEPFFSGVIGLLVVVVPLISMRAFAEERGNGTFELLLTSPARLSQIIMGKFLGMFLALAFMLLSVMLFPMLLCVFGDPEQGPILSGFIGVLLACGSFLSVALVSVSFARSQLSGAVVAFVILLLFCSSHIPVEFEQGSVALLLKMISVTLRVEEFLQGVISLSGMVYFVSLMAAGIFLSKRVLEAEIQSG